MKYTLPNGMTVDENGIQVLPDDNQQSSETTETVSQVTTASGINIGEEARKAMSRDTANDQGNEKVEGGSASAQSGNEKHAPSGEEWYYRRAQEIQNEHPDWTTDQITNKMSEEIWNNNYNALMENIGHSKTPAERDEKIEQYKSQLLEYYISGIDVDNDVEYLREVQGVEPQYRLSPDNPAFVDATLSFQDRANGYDLEDNENHVKWRIKPSRQVHPDDWDNYLIQQEYKQSILTVSDSNVITSENVHKFFDVAGFLPAAGIFPDLGNSALYLFESNYEEAGNSAIAAVPFAGDYFAAVVKGSKIIKGVEEVNKAKPSEIARSWQGTEKYPGVDRYRDIKLKEGTVIYRGEPNGTEYFTTKSAVERSGGDATKLFEGLQVEKHEMFGYRSSVQGYLVKDESSAAFSITKANLDYGKGGLPQIFVQDANELIEKGVLVPVDKINLINYK
ncbi:MAG: hypothetical protein K0Q53_1230 [Massilibacillus sp.]|jgi:hypothetical protein|nr:hypothetical protein [Massilibacillus sp.]